MRVCVIVRGEAARKSRKYIDAIMCWNNWKQTIVDDLEKAGHTCEFAFITYPCEIIEQIRNQIKPLFIEMRPQNTQIENFADVLTFMENQSNAFDRFLIIRCDFRYRIPITKWPKWDKSGIFIVNRDVHWPTLKLYADTLFMVDRESIDIFTNAFYSNIYYSTIHGLGGYLYENNLPFVLLYEEYYNMDKHPLFALASIETEEPDIDNPVTNISNVNV